MGIFSFRKTPKPRPFGFKPRYYDQAKEELELRISRYDKSEKYDAELTKSRIKQGLKMRMRPETDTYQSSARRSNIRLLGIIVVLALAAIMLLKSDRILKIIQVFSGDMMID